jgi:DNA primase
MTIEELKEVLTIEEVLAYWGGEVSGRRGGWGDWQPVNCPFCSDSNGSASVNRQAGLFLCHQCGAPDRDNGKAGDIVDLVKFAERIRDTKEAIEWLRTTFRT